MISKSTALASLSALLLAYSPELHAKATITEFDVPNAVGTLPLGINLGGSVAGYWWDTVTDHAFIRTADGTITTFDPAGSQDSLATSINDGGVVAGWYLDSTGMSHGFLRAADGTMTVIDVPGAKGTSVASINNSGTIAGVYYDDNYNWHGYIRTTDGTITPFDPPGSTSTEVQDINDKGAVTGDYGTTSGVPGFLRKPNGTIISFQVNGESTFPNSINDKGAIAGVTGYFGCVGFVRAPDGSLTTFYVAKDGCPEYAYINGKGAVTGPWSHHAPSKWRGFIRRPSGTFKTFTADGAGTGLDQGTFPLGINDTGSIAGYFEDSNGNDHGFVRTP